MLGGTMRLAAAAIAVAATALVGCSDSGSSSSPPKSTTKAAGQNGAPGAPATTIALTGTLTKVDAVLPGMCFNALPDKQQRLVAVLVIGCEDPHTFEAFATFTSRLGSKKSAAAATTPTPTATSTVQSKRGASTTTTKDVAAPAVAYPGAVPVRDDAEAQCVGAFEEWMGLPWTSSTYDIQSWWPSDSSWARGDRAILCAAYRVAGGTTKGSVRGTAQ